MFNILASKMGSPGLGSCLKGSLGVVRALRCDKVWGHGEPWRPDSSAGTLALYVMFLMCLSCFIHVFLFFIEVMCCLFML